MDQVQVSCVDDLLSRGEGSCSVYWPSVGQRYRTRLCSRNPATAPLGPAAGPSVIALPTQSARCQQPDSWLPLLPLANTQHLNSQHHPCRLSSSPHTFPSSPHPSAGGPCTAAWRTT